MSETLEVNHFKKEILADRPQIGLWSSLCSPIVADIVSTVGFDWVLIDMEHSPNEMMTVLSQLQVYRASKTKAIVRPPWNDPVMTKRLLDLGADTLLFPMIQSAQEAEMAVRSCRYPPNGIRGVSLVQRANRFGAVTDYIARAEEEICVLVQIETKAALDRVDEIVAVNGIDGVFFGPADLSADFGHLGSPGHPSVVEAIAGGVERVRAAGKPAGILVGEAAQAREWLDRGVRFVACSSDLNLLVRGARNLIEDLR